MHYELIVAWMADQIWGDPMWLPHPVVYMGRWISYWEHRLNKGTGRKCKGALLALSSVALTYAFAAALMWALSQLSVLCHDWEPTGWGGYAGDAAKALLTVLLIFFCLAGCTLRREVKMVFEAVDRGLDEGRRQVARIVGRDTQNLSAQQVRTAALETLAENLSDGVVAPLFWYVLLGVPGMLAYKMVNTLDSMIGYHSPRYKDFGCWAAHIDDVANYIPARITALLMILAGWLLGLLGQCAAPGTSPRLGSLCRFTPRLSSLCRFTLRYGPQHASPNSGWPEAALAAILDCRFGGSHDYFGEVFHKPHIGHNDRLLNTHDMQLSLSVCLMAETVAVLLAFCL